MKEASNIPYRYRIFPMKEGTVPERGTSESRGSYPLALTRENGRQPNGLNGTLWYRQTV